MAVRARSCQRVEQGHPGRVRLAVQLRHRECRSGSTSGLRHVEPGHDPMDRVDRRPRHPRVGQEGQAEIPRAGAVPGSVAVCLVATVGCVPVVSVGDHRAPFVQITGDARQLVRVGQRPDAVRHTVIGRGAQQRCGRHRRRHELAGEAAAGVQQEDRFEVRPGGHGQGEPVGHRAGHGVLVRQDDPRVRVRESHRADQAPLDVVAVDLLVHVQRRSVVEAQDAGGDPLAQGPPGTAVPTVGGVLVGVTGQDQADDIVRMRRLQRGDARRVDHVVGRGGPRRQIRPVVGHIPQGTKRREHESAGCGQGRVASSHAAIVGAGRPLWPSPAGEPRPGVVLGRTAEHPCR